MAVRQHVTDCSTVATVVNWKTVAVAHIVGHVTHAKAVTKNKRRNSHLWESDVGW